MTTMSKEPGEKFFILGKKGQTMELEIPLTPEHLNAIHKQIAEVSADTFRLEEEKKLAVQPFNEKLKAAKTRERELISQKERGVMKVAVPVETRGDWADAREAVRGEEKRKGLRSRRSPTIDATSRFAPVF